MRSFFEELQRRNVTRSAFAYLAAAWLIIEVADTLMPRFGFDDTAITVVIVLLAIGFIPALVLAWFFEITPGGVKLDDDAEAIRSRPARETRVVDRLIVGMLIAAVSVLLVDKFVLDPARDREAIEAATEAARADAAVETVREKSIAVMAFRDLSPASDQAYLSEGIAEDVLTLLTKVRELRVISRSSSFSFKNSEATTREIADALEVSYLLEGSVRRYDNRLRVSVQLVDTATDANLWTENFDRELGDVFVIQDEITASILDNLRVTLLANSPTSQKVDPLAYEMYLRAQHIIHTENTKEFREAQALLNSVIELAPDYVPALNALGRLYYRIPKREGLSPDENRAEIVAIADRVVEIDPNGISSLIWQGWLAYEGGQLEAAADFYERAIDLDPNNTSLLRVLVSFLVRIDRPDDAVAVGRYLLHRDPACAVCVNNLGYALRATNQPRESAEVLQSLLKWHSPVSGFYWTLGVSWLAAGEPELALAAFEGEVNEGSRELGIIMALHDLGREAEFQARFARFRDSQGDNESTARVYAWIGEVDEAYTWLEKMVAEGGASTLAYIDTELYNKIKTDPRWDTLRSAHGYSDEQVRVDFAYELPSGTAGN